MSSSAHWSDRAPVDVRTEPAGMLLSIIEPIIDEFESRATTLRARCKPPKVHLFGIKF